MSEFTQRLGKFGLSWISASLAASLGVAPLPATSASAASAIKINIQNVATPLGCANPYSAPFTTDWGVRPSYKDSYKSGKITDNLKAQGYIDPPTQLSSWPRPKYSSNHIFWLSRENAPGQSVVMSGAFTPAPKNIRLAPIPFGARQIKPLLDVSSIIVASTPMGSTGLAFRVPMDFPTGPFAFRIEDPSTALVDAIANLPEVQWTLGVMPTDPDADLPADVFSYPPISCGVMPGGMLRIFGKNYLAGANVYLADAQGDAFQLSVARRDENSIAAGIPANINPGSYFLWIGNSARDAASSALFPVKVMAAVAPKVKAIVCPNLLPTSGEDISAGLQNCLENNIPTEPTKVVNVLELPAGDFHLAQSIALHPGQYLRGEGVSKTTIGGVSSAPPDSWFSGTHHFGLANLSFHAPVRNSLLRSDLTGSPLTSGYITINRVALKVDALAPTDARQPVVQLSGPAIQIIDATLSSLTGVSSSVAYADGVWINGFNQTQGQGGWAAIGESQNVIVENSTFSGPSLGSGITGGGLAFTLTFSPHSAFPRSEQVQRNAYLGYNTLQNMMAPGAGASQAFTTDGGSQAYYGTIASSTSTSVTLMHDPDWSFTGNTIPDGLIVAVIAGGGAGQYRHMSGYDKRRIVIATPWTVPPDSTSVVVVSQVNKDMTISHNIIKNCAADAILAYGLVFEALIEKNILIDAGHGINVMAFGPYGDAFYNSTFNVELLRNIITNTSDLNYLIANGGIVLSEQPGTALSGVVVRGNTIALPQFIRASQGYSNNIANMVELNNYTLDPVRKLMNSVINTNPGFLVEGINYDRPR
jgi:hypothetical protein